MIQKPQSLITLKLNGDLLNASDWNDLVSYVDDVKTAAESNAGSGGGTSGGGTITTPDGVISVNSKGNVSISSLKHINLEPAYVVNGGSGTYGDVLIKPGDDITLESHHRATEKRDEITVKTSNGQDGTAKAPVKLLIISSDMTLSTKGKKGDDTNVMNVNVTTGEGKGYLKVRAQAIDLRCEEHGGVAIQPKGFDGDGNMNKIKFEHGGGDGLEFGTFNTEKTSIFTDEYRFNKEGVWKMATRLKVASGKEVKNEGTVPTGKSATGAYKYVKQADDFYDVINPLDEQCTTEDIIKTAHALNNDYIETEVSAKNNFSISSANTYKIQIVENIQDVTGRTETLFSLDSNVYSLTDSFTKDQLKEILSGDVKLSSYIGTTDQFLVRRYVTGATPPAGAMLGILVEDVTPKIAIESENEVDLDAKYGDVVITSGDTIKCEAPEIRLNALNEDKTGGMVNFGATQDIVFINSKLTKGLKVEASANPTKIKLVLQNNTIDTVYWDETNLIFRVPVKRIYADNQHTTEITPDNYNTYKELAAYFYDGTKLPADYTCFIAVVTESNGTYTTNIYKVSTKGSSDVLSKNIKGPVGRYTSSTSGVLGNRVALNTADELTTLEFEFENYSGGAGVSAVNPDSFVTVKEIELSDIIDIISELKTMKTNNQGPWAV